MGAGPDTHGIVPNAHSRQDCGRPCCSQFIQVWSGNEYSVQSKVRVADAIPCTATSCTSLRPGFPVAWSFRPESARVGPSQVGLHGGSRGMPAVGQGRPWSCGTRIPRWRPPAADAALPVVPPNPHGGGRVTHGGVTLGGPEGPPRSDAHPAAGIHYTSGHSNRC